jgi:tetratricopeptide (TPR) repeat protein
MSKRVGPRSRTGTVVAGDAPDGESRVGLVMDAALAAETVLEDEARQHPTYADVRHRLGLLHLLREDPEGAEREFEEALGINPGYRAAYYGLRFARMQAGHPLEPASEPDDRTGATAEEHWWRKVDTAYVRLAAGQDPGHELISIEGREGQLLYHHYAGYFALREGDRAKARKHFKDAAALSEITRGALQDGSGGSLANGSPEVERSLETMLWTPLAEALYTYLGRIYARNGLRREALECYERAYLVFPRDAEHAMHRAQIATVCGEEQEALQLLTTAIAADPTSVRARIALGYEYASQGFLQDARTEFQVAASLAPGYADVRYNLGLLYVGEGRLEEALREFRRALALNPAYLPARHSMSHLLCRLGRYDEGLQEYNRILKQGFQSGDMLVQMGKAALALERIDEAIEYLERAVFLNPEFAPSYYYIGQAYQRRGLKNKARSAWRSYLEKVNDWEPLRAASDEAPPEPSV